MKTFSAMTERSGRNLLVVDTMNLAFRWLNSGRSMSQELVSTAESIANSYKCGKIIYVTDMYGSKYRKAMYPEYKANRKKRSKDEEEVYNTFFEHLNALYSVLDKKNCLIRREGVEADDIIACIAQNMDQIDIDNIWILSTDKDLDQLISPKVSRFSTITRKEYTIETFPQLKECRRPEDYIFIKVLQGDSSDNITGVPLVGPKRALSLLQSFIDTEDLLDSLPIPGKAKFIQNINQSADTIIRNDKLMNLRKYYKNAIEAGDSTIESIMEELNVKI